MGEAKRRRDLGLPPRIDRVKRERFVHLMCLISKWSPRDIVRAADRRKL